MQDIDLVNEGADLFTEGKFAESVEKYDAAIKINPKSKEAYYNKGVSYQELNDHNKANESFEAALKIDPNFMSAIIGEGNSYSSLGDKDKAITFYDRALQIHPNFFLAYLNKGICLYEARRLDEVDACLDKAIALNQESYIPFLIKANTARELDNKTDATNSYKLAVEKNYKLLKKILTVMKLIIIWVYVKLP